MIEKENSHAMAIHEPKKGMLSFINCLSLMGGPNMTAVKISIQNGRHPGQSICKIKSMVGSKKLTLRFFSVFSKLVDRYQSSEKVFFYEDE